MSAPSPVLVNVPAGPDLVHIIRAVAASVAARLDMPIDAVEEVRVAVDEAASILLQVPAPYDRLSLTIEPLGTEMNGLLSIDAGTAEWPPPGAEASWSWRVISSVCDKAAFERSGVDPAIRFIKRGSMQGR